MKRVIIIFIVLFAVIFPANSQTAITLSDCYDAALINHSLKEEKQQLGKIWEMKDANTVSGWYPSIEAGADIIYNTRVIDLASALESLPIPGIAENIGGMPHDQYKLTLDIQQVIWDGGIIKGSRELEKRSLLVKEQEVEIELYRIKEQVASSFFGLIILSKQEELLRTYFEIINERIKDVESAIENGFLLATDRDILRAEGIRIEQQLSESAIRINSVRLILSDITGYDLTPGTLPVLPDISVGSMPGITRPELQAIDLKQDQLEAGKSIIKSSRMPKAYGFATLGYGNPPGNDFFNDSFGTYAVFGAAIKWSIYDWNKSKRDRQIIDINKNILASRKTEIEDNLKRVLENKQAEILAYEAMIGSDRELINLRQTITGTAESRFRNGSITATEYLAELNAEKQAVINYELHQISYIRAKAEYMNIAGTDIE